MALEDIRVCIFDNLPCPDTHGSAPAGRFNKSRCESGAQETAKSLEPEGAQTEESKAGLAGEQSQFRDSPIPSWPMAG